MLDLKDGAVLQEEFSFTGAPPIPFRTVKLSMSNLMNTVGIDYEQEVREREKEIRYDEVMAAIQKRWVKGENA